MIRTLLAITFSLVLLPLAACAQDGQTSYIEGTHYTTLSQPVRTRNKDKIEVVEMFWYGCGHCYNFEPLIISWSSKVAADVDFWQSPAMWNAPMKLHAQAFYTAQALGVLEKIHNPMFSALNVDRSPLRSQKAIADLFAQNGVAREEFNKAFNSFGVKSQVRQADARARSYKITGTPEIVVNGKYLVSTRMSGGQAEMLKIVDFLVAKERG
ncbi:MAG: thiol:disulfide interchange protein DsbA [Halieaceae bacterium]|jgi:thiol:disulfide interchange protein DsbA